MSAKLEELVDSLLYEGYALYPYTPGAVKNATPTPFGILYPPSYAAQSGATFDHLQMECVLETQPEATVEVQVSFLQAVGERHQGVARKLTIPPVAVQELTGSSREVPFSFENLAGRLRLSAEPRADGSQRIRLRVENATSFANDTSDRAIALRSAFISTHPVLKATGATFLSPLEADDCSNVNTWPVLAAEDDTVVLGAAIVLPDHPQISPSSKGNLFDNTEIEEALLLHVHTLSDDEKESIGSSDPVVKEMIDRALATTPEDMIALHGEFQAGANDVAGLAEVLIGERTLTRGQKVVLRLGGRTDVYDQMLNGRIATLERIYLDYDDKVYLGVTVDSDPMQEVFRETGRYLFFFPDELEALPE